MTPVSLFGFISNYLSILQKDKITLTTTFPQRLILIYTYHHTGHLNKEILQLLHFGFHPTEQVLISPCALDGLKTPMLYIILVESDINLTTAWRDFAKCGVLLSLRGRPRGERIGLFTAAVAFE